MAGLRLYKKEKLCSTKAIDMLFARGQEVEASLAYPLRAMWRRSDKRAHGIPQFVIVVPKKRLRHAVDRVQMRRRIREAYRLCRNQFTAPDMPADIGFIYVADSVKDYGSVQRAMVKLLSRINTSFADENAE